MAGTMICGCDYDRGCFYHGCPECHGANTPKNPHKPTCSLRPDK